MSRPSEAQRKVGSDMNTALSASSLTLVGRRTARAASAKVVRQAEWILFAFLLYTPALTFFVPTTPGLRARLASLNLVVIVSYAGLVCLGSVKPRVMLEVARDWLPLGMIVLAYREMGWFAKPHQAALLEWRWISWDRFVLGH